MQKKPLPYPTIKPKPANYPQPERDPNTRLPLLKLSQVNLDMLAATAISKVRS